MEIIYRTIDGQEFKSDHEAQHHELQLFQDIKMWNRNGIPTKETTSAFVVYLADENASKAFLAMAKAQGDDLASSICEGDYGIFYWDECDGVYRFIDEDELRGIYGVGEYLRSIGRFTPNA